MTTKKAEPEMAKKIKSSISITVQSYELPDAARLSRDIPDKVKAAIASVVIAFADMEMSAELAIWDLIGVSMEDGKLISQGGTNSKFSVLKALTERYGIPIHGNAHTSADIWALIDIIVQARNKIVHGSWNMIDKVEPISISYRIKTDFGRIAAEHFPIERLELIAAECRKIKDLIDQMCRHIASLPTKPAAQPQEPITTLPEYPLQND